MGARLGFADVLLSKLADVPPPVVVGRPTARIASPSWVHRLEPLRVVPASFLHSRYPQSVSAAPAAGGIPVAAAQEPLRGGSQASSRGDRDGAPDPVARRKRSPAGCRGSRTQRERLAIQLLNRLGANLGPRATDEEIRSAYRLLLRQWHPDMHPGATATERESHARTLRAIVRAWEVFQGRASHLRP